MSRLNLPLAVALLLLLTFTVPAWAQQDLAAAKELYTAAKYEEALGVLDSLKDAKPIAPDVALGIEQYRAMCLLALNRKADAEQAIEAVADLDPFYQPAEDDAAPWVRAAFRETRRKVLPAALQRLYGRAKEAYNRKEMSNAVVAFTRVMKILEDPDLALDKGAKDDLKMVAQGFMDLAQAAASAPPPAAQPPAAPPATPSRSCRRPLPRARSRARRPRRFEDDGGAGSKRPAGHVRRRLQGCHPTAAGPSRHPVVGLRSARHARHRGHRRSDRAGNGGD